MADCVIVVRSVKGHGCKIDRCAEEILVECSKGSSESSLFEVSDMFSMADFVMRHCGVLLLRSREGER